MNIVHSELPDTKNGNLYFQKLCGPVLMSTLFCPQADVELTFPEGSATKKDDQYRYSARPEIKVRHAHA